MQKQLYSEAYIRSSENLSLEVAFLSMFAQGSYDFLGTAKIGKLDSSLFSSLTVKDLSVLHLSFLSDHGEGIDSLFSTYLICNVNEMSSYAIFKPLDSNFYSTFYVANEELLKSKYCVKDYAMLDIVYNLVQAPDIIVDHDCIKDTYVTSYRPTLNYGRSSSLLTGPALQGDTKIYLYFNVAETMAVLNKDVLVMDIRLNLTLPQETHTKLKVTVIDSDWDEYSVTWRTKLRHTNITKEFEVTGKSCSLDITDLIYTLKEQGVFVFNVMIESEDECLIYSKESKYPPSIRTVWRDNTWTGFVDESDLISTAWLRSIENRDFFSYAKIVERTHLSSTAVFQKLRFDVESSTTILGFEESLMQGTVKLEKVKNNFNSYAKISNKLEDDLYSTFYNPNTFLPSYVDVYANDNLYSTFFIKQDQENNLESFIVIKSPNINGVAEIIEKTEFSSEAVIRRSGELDVTSISKLNELGEDISSYVDIPVGYFNKVLSSLVSVTGTNLSNTVDIKKILEIYSTAFIHEQEHENFISTVNIYNSLSMDEDMESTVSIKALRTHILSTSYINGFYENLFENSVEIVYPSTSLQSSVEIALRDNDELPSNARIKLIDKDFDNNAYIKGFEDSLFSGFAYIKELESVMSGEVTIRQKAYKDLIGFSQIALDAEKDLYNYANIFYKETINSIAELYRIESLQGEAIIRQLDIAEVDSVARLGQSSIISDISVSVVIKASDSKELCSNVNIRSSARHWIPNVHAPDIFKFNRKLPRQI